MQNLVKGAVPETWRGRAVLMLCHFVGMVDLVALPVWVGALVQHYRFGLEQAGITVTAFLAGAVAASLVAAPRFGRLPRVRCVVAGYGVAALAFAGAASTAHFGVLVLLHAVAGIAAGTALSVTHGTIGRSANPHRMFALAGTALGVGAVVFYGAVPPAIAAHGGATLFEVLAGLMALAALAGLAFPTAIAAGRPQATHGRLSRAAWCATFGVAAMALNQALTFSMLDRIGIMRGFGQEAVNQLLVAVGLINLVPAAVAGLLDKRLNPVRVALAAAPLQAALAVTISLASGYPQYALAACVYPAVLIFMHTFLFGLIARLDPSGRALAATPAMMMAGSAIGPALAGAVATHAGFGGLALLAATVGTCATLCFALVARQGGAPAAAAA